jgi:hypothetical protein
VVRPPLARRIAKAGIAVLRPQPMTRSGQGGESLGSVAAKGSDQSLGGRHVQGK